MQIIVLVKTFNRTITFWMVGRAKNQLGVTKMSWKKEISLVK
jgi:hypothetical protein